MDKRRDGYLRLNTDPFYLSKLPKSAFSSSVIGLVIVTRISNCECASTLTLRVFSDADAEFAPLPAGETQARVRSARPAKIFAA